MRRIAVLGSLNVDLVARVARAPEAGETVIGESFAIHPGGKGANQAFAAGKLGGEVAMIGRVGEDDHGRAQVENLKSVSVSIDGVRAIRGEPTGTAMIVVEASGENRIVVVGGANGGFDRAELLKDSAVLEGAGIALFQLETPLETVLEGLRRAKEGGALTILDPAPARELPEEMFRFVDYLTPNATELAVLTGMDVIGGDGLDLEVVEAAARSLLAKGVGKVLAKLGKAGALLVSVGGCERYAGFEVEALDSTAAGDCFNGAFAVALARGETEREAARFACAAAALSVTREGAQSSIPSEAEVEDFLKNQD